MTYQCRVFKRAVPSFLNCVVLTVRSYRTVVGVNWLDDVVQMEDVCTGIVDRRDVAELIPLNSVLLEKLIVA